MTKQILLTCGAGASSGFMAASARKAAKKMGADLEIKAKSETEVEEALPVTDLLLVAPHLKYMVDEVKELCEANQVKCEIIPQRIYGALDGKGLVEFIENQFEGERHGK
ncbi:MAG: PTS sugar transporter subunit IIB [Lactococcus sp.]